MATSLRLAVHQPVRHHRRRHRLLLRASAQPAPASRPFRQLTRALSSLPLALSEMGVLAALSALGTVIEQNKDVQHYVDSYPVEHAVLGFVSYPLILGLGLDHVYQTWYFWGLNGLLACSLAACSLTNQLPQLRVARDWRFSTSRTALARMPVHAVMADASSVDLARALSSRGYQVFLSRTGRLYGFKGLVGKLAPLGVHAALLLSMAGFLGSALGGSVGSAMVSEGSSFVLSDALRPASPLASLLTPRGAAAEVTVDSFRVEYYPTGAVSQFYSDLAVAPRTGAQPEARVAMKVNVPLRYGGVTAYQTDWSIASVTVRVGERGDARADGAGAFALPMVSLEGAPGFAGRIWGTAVPLPALPGSTTTTPRAASLVARDFQSVAVYGPDGAFVGVRRPGSGSVIVVDGVPLVVERLTGATGLELKADPGVPAVYAGFGTLIATTILSFRTHSTVWAEESEEGDLHVGGKTTKQKEAFALEMEEVFAGLPQYTAPTSAG